MINHGSATPKYIQLADSLENEIKNGIIKADERLYSENELCRKYGVSRITVRQALHLLEAKDLIYTVHGKGTYVKAPMFSQNLPKIVSFSKMLYQKGLSGSTMIKSFNRNTQNSRAADILKNSASDRLANLNLIAYLGNLPVAFYQSFFSIEVGEEMYYKAQEKVRCNKPFTTLDLYSETKIKLGHVEQTITAETPDLETAGIFGLPENTALIVLESVFYDEGGNPVEYKLGHYRADIYSFKITRTL